MKIIKLEDLTVSYEKKEVVKDVSIDICAGDYVCIVGDNGSGKSTLVESLLCLVPIKSGKVFFNDITKKDIGYLPQQTTLQYNFPASVNEVIMSGFLNNIGKKLFYSKANKQKAKDIIDELGIGKLINKAYNELSGGEKQRVLLARALCATTKVLILDEPVTGLDPNITKDFYKLILKLNQNKKITIIMVSHDIDMAINYANKILHIDNKVLFYGATEKYVECDICNDWLGDKCVSRN